MPGEQTDALAPLMVFYSYAHEDERLRKRLEKHLSLLRQQGLITEWHDRQILPGTDWARDIDTHLLTAQVILLLISPDFLASDYCYGVEMRRALARHAAGEAQVIPILLRPVDWENAPFAFLQCLPREGKPITQWNNQDEALVTVAKGLRAVIEQVHPPVTLSPSPTPLTPRIPSLLKHQTQPFAASEDRDRQRMLERVRKTWITGVLEHSLHDATLIALGLREEPGVLANPWRLVVQEVDRPAQPLPAGTRITEVYDGAGGALLILGEPGAGKTTLLLELARDLLTRAHADEREPIPVVFNLSSWAQKRAHLADWLVEELYLRYQVPRTLGQTWVDHDQLLLLLDGLDEVVAAQRSGCIQAINGYRQAHPLVPVAVCSRSADYLNQAEQLGLQRAVVVQPLTAQQIDAYLASAGEQIAAVRVALHNDPVLQQLATTPLMLNILILAYQDGPLEGRVEGGSAVARQEQLFASYVQHMLKRRRAETRYTPEQTTRWLSRLANQMKGQSVFYLEQMQPTWLPTRWAYRVSIGLLVGLLCLFVALLAGLIFGMSSSIGQPTGLLVGLIVGSSIGLVGGFLSGLRREITPAERVTWSWKRALWGCGGTGLVVFWLNSWLQLLLYVFIPRPPLSPSIQSSFSSPFLLFLVLLCIIIPIIIGLRIKLKPLRVVWSWKRALWGCGGTGLVVYWLDISSFSASVLFVFSVLLLTLLVGLISGLRIKLKPFRVAWSWKRALWGCGGTGLVVYWLGVFWAVFLNVSFLASGLFVFSVLLLTLLVGLISGLRIKLKPFRIAWSWKRALRGGLVVVCLLALLMALLATLGLPFLLPIELLIGLFFGISGNTLDKSAFTRPNEGIRRSVRNSMLSGAIVALTLGSLLPIIVLIIVAIGAPELKWSSLGEQWISALLPTLPFALPIIMISVLIIGLIVGGLACLQHIALRVFLQRKKVMPWNYPQFLDYAAERILLCKVGGSYIFIHRLLQDYFASLETIPVPEKSPTHVPSG